MGLINCLAINEGLTRPRYECLALLGLVNDPAESGKRGRLPFLHLGFLSSTFFNSVSFVSLWLIVSWIPDQAIPPHNKLRVGGAGSMDDRGQRFGKRCPVQFGV